MLRSHFGDLQFLHSMAATRDETAGQTRRKILMWAELTWRVAIGEFNRGTVVANTGIDNIRNYFRPGETIQTLFTRGNPTHRPRIGEFAFGSLLHTLHDSFTRSHTDRDEADGSLCGPGLPDRPGRIRQFLNYSLQDSGLHGDQDTRAAADLQIALVQPDMIDIGRVLRDKLAQGALWEDVQPLMACIFDVEDENTPSGPGAFAKQ